MSSAGLTREQAHALLQEHLMTPNLVKHCLATEAILRALAPRFGADPEAWGITGLLHDLDLDLVEGDPVRHGETGARLAAAAGLEEEFVEAIRRHPPPLASSQRCTTLDHALVAAETITGLIVATALVYPDRRLASVKPRSIRKRFREARFAAGASREQIRECEQIGIPLDEFVELSLLAMQEVAEELGL